MLNRQYYEGYEGEGEIKVWSDCHGHIWEMVIWIGYFETILDGCFSSKFEKDGIIACYYNLDGFYDGKWKMRYPYIVLKELKNFNEKKLLTRDSEMIEISKEIIAELISLIKTTINNGGNIYIEYE